MEITVHDDRKIVEIWLNHDDQRNDALQTELKSLYGAYKHRGYLVAVFRSGNLDLAEETSALLVHNRRRIAELEMRREKA